MKFNYRDSFTLSNSGFNRLKRQLTEGLGHCGVTHSIGI